MSRKSFAHPARLCYAGHVLMEHRQGLVADAAAATQSTGRAERDTSIAMLSTISGEHRITVAGDKAYDTRRGVARVDFQFVLTMAAYNLIRLRPLLEPAPT